MTALNTVVSADRSTSNRSHNALPDHIGAHATAHSSDSCVTCHTIDTTLSHPQGFVSAGRTLPTWAPLEHGRMTCLTCHDVSGSDARGGRADLLRSTRTGAAFCAECHGDESPGGSPHAQATTRAHLAWSGIRSDAHDPHLSASGLDAESSACMSCHDGSLAMDAGANHRSGGPFMSGLAPEHPVGVPYVQRLGARAMDSLPLRPHAALDDRIRLFRGNIGCGSCHSVYSHQPDMLVMSNDRSALCLTCHAL